MALKNELGHGAYTGPKSLFGLRPLWIFRNRSKWQSDTGNIYRLFPSRQYRYITYRPIFKDFDTSARKTKYTIGKLAKNATTYMNSRSGASVEPGQIALTLYTWCKVLRPQGRLSICSQHMLFEKVTVWVLLRPSFWSLIISLVHVNARSATPPQTV